MLKLRFGTVRDSKQMQLFFNIPIIGRNSFLIEVFLSVAVLTA